MRLHGPQEPVHSARQFQELIKLVSEPQSTVTCKQPGFMGEITHFPSGTFNFQTIESGRDTVMFSAQTDKDGNQIKPLEFETNGMRFKPTLEMARNLFFGRVVQPFHDLFFNAKEP